MGNKKYNIDDTRKISGVVNVPTSGNSIIYPKIDDNWYIMGSDGIEFRLSKDIDFGDGFTITSGFVPYGSKVDVSIGLGLRFDIDGKIEVNVDEFTSIIVGDKFIEKTDFLVNNLYAFEVGGKDKTNKQILNIENSFIAADGIEYGYQNKIPLWLFGFLY